MKWPRCPPDSLTWSAAAVAVWWLREGAGPNGLIIGRLDQRIHYFLPWSSEFFLSFSGGCLFLPPASRFSPRPRVWRISGLLLPWRGRVAAGLGAPLRQLASSSSWSSLPPCPPQVSSSSLSSIVPPLFSDSISRHGRRLRKIGACRGRRQSPNGGTLPRRRNWGSG